ncbi:MAG: ATPase, T2SS/T4P/T4SS family [Alphaproteobacteria bacterium]|nr:ATPase, T2SS/T4P/T4SS family [Alphaproteobacteria bacterium]
MTVALPREDRERGVDHDRTADVVRGFGELLLDRGRLDEQGLRRAKLAEAKGAEPLHRLLPKLGMVSEQDVAECLADALGLPLASDAEYRAASVAPERVSASFLRQARIMPLEETGTELIIATADPLDDYAISAIRLYAQKTITVKVGLPADVDAALDRLFGQKEIDGELIEAVGAADAPADDDIERLRDLASEAPVVRIVNRLIVQAVEQRASDIHIKLFEQRLRVRYRIDGLLTEGETPPVALHAAIISRLKIMAGLDIAERRLPQDGRIRLAVRGRDIDLRVATMPIMHGEAVVLRILDRASVRLELETLGYGGDKLKAYRDALKRPNGVVLVTGPTGSGKTTTLYASLAELNSEEYKILTVEDPIEYQLAGTHQVQIKPAIGLSFAHVLRAMLRHDPDVIMVGEIRDLETVDIAIQAALTGHLVFSTLHTNSAAGTLTRHVDMGVEPYLLASTLNAIVAQRLVRRLCMACRQPFEPPPSLRGEIGLPIERPATLWRAVGCAVCGGSGYAGRLCAAEVLTMAEPIRALLMERSDAGALERLAREHGMQTMFEDGVAKALIGVTTVEEVMRVSREVD